MGSRGRHWVKRSSWGQEVVDPDELPVEFYIHDVQVKTRVVFNVRQSYCARYSIGWTSVRLSVRHTLALCRNGSTYRQTVFTAW